MLKTYSIL